jgi:hypothetical protein
MSVSFPLTTLEELLFWEDRPAYPWSCFVRAHLSGRIDRPAFESAATEALKRHPLLSATVERRGRGHLRWVVADEPRSVIRWESGPVGGPFPHATRLDLFREIGIRFHVVVDGDLCDVVIQFHHACCDGSGILAFIHDMLIAYAVARGEASDQVQLPPLDPHGLATRGRFGLTLGKFLRMLPRQMVGLAGARQFLMRSPAPIIPHRADANDGPLPAAYPAVLSHVLDAEDTRRLRTAAMQRGIRLNDLLARDLFLALGEWRSRQGIAADGQWLRMMVPMNLRTAGDLLLPALNRSSSVFLDRRAADLADADRLAQSIHDEMDLIKRYQLGFTFVFSTQICNLLPGALKKQVRANRHTVSCIFSNLGKLFLRSPLPWQAGRIVAGNMTLDSFEVVAPVRPCGCVTFVTSIYADQLTITLHYDPRPLTREQAADILNGFVRRLQMQDQAG